MGLAFRVDRLRQTALRGLNYVPEIEALRAKRASRESASLGSLLKAMGPAYGAVFTRIDCSAEHGVELVSQTDMFATEPVGRLIRRDSMARPDRHQVERNQVLIAAAGTLGDTELYGRSIIADARLEGKYVGPHAMVLHFLEPGSSESLFAYAFLCSSLGIRAVRSCSFGTKILGVRKDLLAALPIPAAPTSQRESVAALVRRAVEGREAYVREINRARQVVSELPAVREATEVGRRRRGRCVEWNQELRTMCAWNYASAGASLSMLRGRWHARLGDIIEDGGVFNGPRFARVEVSPPHGIEFLSQRDLFLVRPVARRIARPNIPDHMLFAPENALLIGSHGQLSEGGLFGRVELAHFGAARAGLTQDIMRLTLLEPARLLGYAFLSTRLGCDLLKSTAVGTSIPSVRLDLLRALPFPEVEDRVLASVSLHLRAAIESRKLADAAEAEAIRIVEEEVLPQWLA